MQNITKTHLILSKLTLTNTNAQLSLEANYKISKRISIGLGGAVQSGNDNGSIVNEENKAFTQFYGTNHKFNGLLNYFYVGNHINNVGPVDIYAKTKIAVTNMAKFNIALHNLSAAADISGTNSKLLETELDLGYSYQFIKEVNIQAGYSHMFASHGLEIIKNNFDNNANDCAAVMASINPTLFKTETKKNNQ